MAEPVTPAGWVALLAAILLPVVVGFGGLWFNQQRDAAAVGQELLELRVAVLHQEEEIRRLRREVTMLEEDLTLVLEVD